MRGGFRFLSRLAGRDIAPGPDNLQRLAAAITDKVLLVIYPAIGSILPAEAVLDCVDPVLEEFGYRVFNLSQLVRVNPVAPEGRVLQVLYWSVPENRDDVVADKCRRIITRSLK